MIGKGVLQKIHLGRSQERKNAEHSEKYASISKPYNRFYESESQWVRIPKNKDIFAVDEAEELWVATGDICTMDESGKIRIIDRVGRGFNTFGMNIYPSVIEDVLGMHSDVAESVVVGVEHELMGAAPVANVVVSAGLMERAQALADELDELIARELPSYTRVYAYRFRTGLPYTSRAKPNYQPFRLRVLMTWVMTCSFCAR